MDLKDKYIFRPYSSSFPNLFNKEKERLQYALPKNVTIEHIGSTAVPGLGGKGIIDILVLAPKESWVQISNKLECLSYLYRKKDVEREKEKLFFMVSLPDSELGSRLYHIHLSYPKSPEVKNSVGFRDFLKNNPSKLKEYAEIKEKAALAAQKLTTKDEMRDKYGKMKKEFIDKYSNL